ncbi:hypothetical protein [Thiorhodococcus fuscus]|uniref:Transposase n=1 Tax=Thiorhodococcus fuscus TaxID=527200 RepID=A0ABW4Y790_9GAMM
MSHACRCERCRPDDPEPTDTEAFKLACLARYVLTQADPRAWLDRWRHKHGPSLTQRLREAMRREWMGRRAA